LLTSLVFGAAPALQAARIDLIEAIKEGGRNSAGGSRHRMRSLPVVAQVALALILMVGAGLMMRSFLRLQQVNLGFNPDNALTMRVTVNLCRRRAAFDIRRAFGMLHPGATGDQGRSIARAEI
jgi:hypothetical protein